ncbi:MAG TPA: hypothetical protein DCZ97_04435 [Syntrophus sp. (in: bacteria)]|nr:hypothetical protein [Syntrophus sp. (in: bacteria)]
MEFLKNCPMDIHTGEYENWGEVAVGDCMKCGRCIGACPQNTLSL